MVYLSKTVIFHGYVKEPDGISPSLIHFFKSLSAICWFSSVCQPSADMILLLSNDANEHVEVEARLKDKLRVNCDNLIFLICRVRVLMISDDRWW